MWFFAYSSPHDELLKHTKGYIWISRPLSHNNSFASPETSHFFPYSMRKLSHWCNFRAKQGFCQVPVANLTTNWFWNMLLPFTKCLLRLAGKFFAMCFISLVPPSQMLPNSSTHFCVANLLINFLCCSKSRYAPPCSKQLNVFTFCAQRK